MSQFWKSHFAVYTIYMQTKNQTIAVVGLSDNPDRPSYQVAKFLISEGNTVIPVNPNITSVLGLKSYPSISSIPQDLKIDIIDIFRKSEEVIDIVKEVISVGIKPLIWMQEGIINSKAEEIAKKAGLDVISNKCLMKEIIKSLTP